MSNRSGISRRSHVSYFIANTIPLFTNLTSQIVQQMIILDLLHSLVHGSVDPNHEPSVFARDAQLVKGMGLEPFSIQGISETKAGVHDGPVEFIIRVETPPPTKNSDGILVATGAPKSAPTISLNGSGGSTLEFPIKYGIRSGTVYEFSALANDVGKPTSIKLSNTHLGKDTWTPNLVHVNRIPPSFDNSASTLPNGWIAFDVKRVINGPVNISSVVQAAER